MPQTLPNGITTPINADPYNLTTDLATMGNSANIVISVPSKAARDALTLTPGLTVCRLDLNNAPLQVYDGTQWQYCGRKFKTVFNNSNLTNATGTASRLIADLALPTQSYDRIINVYANVGILSAAISSSVESLYVATSLMQSTSGAAQGLAAVSFVSPGAYLQNGYASTGDILVPAGNTVLARAWVVVVSGTLNTTVSSTALTQIWSEEYAAN